MQTYAWCGLKAGYTIYCYIQYNVYLVFCCLSILLLSGVLVCGNTSRLHASDAEPHGYLFSLCGASDVDEGLEVRDAEGRIIRKAAAYKELQNLYLSTLVILLYQTEIHSVGDSQASLKKHVSCAELMFGLPVKAVTIFTFTVLLPAIKKYFYVAACAGLQRNLKIPILIFPSFLLLVFFRKLSTVILRL